MIAKSVYGIRLRGSREVRYIGVTHRGLDRRLRYHFYAAQRADSAFGRWLLDNRDQIEIFPIAQRSWSDAFALERKLIADGLLLGQRLFNRMHVPSNLRLAA